MGDFLQVITTFPTLPLTVGLGVVVVYWLFALVTGSAFEHGHGVADSVGGAVKGAGDAMVGAVKGAGDAVVGATKAAGEHAQDAGTSLLGVGKVPITMTLSLAALIGWMGSTLACLGLGPMGLALSVAVLVGAIVFGIVAAAFALRPIARALDDRPTRRRDAVGQVCVITSGKVDGQFGTATVADGGAGLNVLVRCARENQLKKGDRAVVVDFDEHHNLYDIEPLDWLLPEEVAALDDPARAERVISSRIRNR